MSAFDLLCKGISLSRKDHRQIKQYESSLVVHRQVPKPISADKYQPEDSDGEVEPDSKARLRRLGLAVTGEDCPPIATNFTRLSKRYGLRKYLLRNLARLGILKPTPVQMAVCPAILQNRSVIATSSTGSGKTCAFALPLLHNLGDHEEGGPRAVVFSHTHELGLQLLQQIAKLAARKGEKALRVGRLDDGGLDSLDVLIATPLRFTKQFGRQNLARLEWVVLDQSDKYFEDSFAEQVAAVIDRVRPLNPKYVLTSATLQHPVQQLLEDNVIERVVRVRVGKQQNTSLRAIEQSLEYCSTEEGKMVFLKNLVLEGKLTPPVLIFCQSKERARQLTSQLRELLRALMGEDRRVQSIHADKEWEVRRRLLEQFESGEIWVLVATDLVARGIDFKRVNLVVNYDFPLNGVSYVHRVGRTGRNGRGGRAITLCTEADRGQIRTLANLLKESGCQPPEWLFRVKKRRAKEHFVEREAISKDPRLHCDPQFYQEKRRMDAVYFRKLRREGEQGEGDGA